MRMLVTVGVGAAAVALPAPALGADREAVARGAAPLTAPVIAGSLVLWGERAPDRGLVVRAAGARGPSTLFRFPPPPARARLSFGGLDASATHVAFIRRYEAFDSGDTVRGGESSVTVKTESATARTTLIAGPLHGPFVHVAGRSGARDRRGCAHGAVEPQEVAVAGPRVVWTERVLDCRARRTRVVDRVMYRNLRTPGPARLLARSPLYDAAIEPPFTVESPRIAGHFAAFQRTRPAGATGVAVVVNLETGRRRIERGNLLETFGVAADGALLTSRHAADGSHELTLRAPGRVGEPLVLGPLDAGGSAGPPEDRYTGFVASGRGRFAFLSITDKARLAIVDRRGRARHPLTFGPGRHLVAGFDYDGRRLVWATGRAGRATIWRSPARSKDRPGDIRTVGQES